MILPLERVWTFFFFFIKATSQDNSSRNTHRDQRAMVTVYRTKRLTNNTPYTHTGMISNGYSFVFGPCCFHNQALYKLLHKLCQKLLEHTIS